MPRLPTADDLNNLMPTATRRLSAADTSGVGRGLQQMGASLTSIASDALAQINQQDLAADSARSVTEWTERSLKIKQDLRENPDWDKAPERAKAAADEAVKAATGVIRDPAARERAAAQYRTQALGIVDDAQSVRFAKSREASQTAVFESLAKTSGMYADPNIDDAVKDGLLKEADATIKAAQDTGLIDAGKALELRNLYVTGSKAKLLENLARSGAVLPALGVGPSSNAPASIRNNNPGAMWPGASARKFGSVGTQDLADGKGNKIATFATPEAGAAAQFDLLASPAYAGMSVSAAIAKWSGGNNSAQYVERLRKAGVDVDGQVATAIRDPQKAIALAKAMATVEAGREFPMSDEQWKSAYDAAFAGGKLPEIASYKYVDPRFEDVPYAQRLAAYQMADQVQKQARATADAQAKVLQSQVREDFQLKIQTDDPTVTPASILGNSLIDSGDKTTLLKALEERQKTTGAANALLVAINSGEKVNLSPFSEDDRKAVDAVYDRLNKASAGDAEAPLKNLDRIQQITGMVPQKAVAQLRGAIVGTATNSATLAMQVANNLLLRNPNAFAGVAGGDDLAKKATAFAFNVENLGMSAVDAAKRVREQDDLRAQGKVKVTDEAVKSFQDGIKKGSFLSTSASGAFDQSWWPGSPDIGTNAAMRQSMLADYAELAGQYFQDGYSGDEAKAIAARDLKKVWGVSKLQGAAYNGTVMRYPPELKYPPAPDANGNVGYGYLVEQAASKIKEVAGRDVKPGDIQFLPIPSRTSVAWGNNGAVPYQLQYTYKDKDGYTIHEILPGVEFVGDPQAAINAYRGKQRLEADQTRKANEEMDARIMAPISAPAPVRPEDVSGRVSVGRGVARPMTEAERVAEAQRQTDKNNAEYEAMRARADRLMRPSGSPAPEATPEPKPQPTTMGDTLRSILPASDIPDGRSVSPRTRPGVRPKGGR